VRYNTKARDTRTFGRCRLTLMEAPYSALDDSVGQNFFRVPYQRF
jgi:hypothetical protein